MKAVSGIGHRQGQISHTYAPDLLEKMMRASKHVVRPLCCCCIRYWSEGTARLFNITLIK